MAHAFEGEPDARQAGEIKPSRFRPRYRKLTDPELALHDAIKAKAAELEALFEEAERLRCPPLFLRETLTAAELEALYEEEDALEALHERGEAKPIAGLASGDPAFGYFADGMRSLELAVMWTIKGLTSSPPDAAGT